MIKEYIEANKKSYWFWAAFYRWAWVPVAWQGWFMVLLFIGLIALDFYRIDSRFHSASDTLINFVPQTVILMGVFFYVCEKTGKKARL